MDNLKSDVDWKTGTKSSVGSGKFSLRGGERMFGERDHWMISSSVRAAARLRIALHVPCQMENRFRTMLWR
ncbi:hypothetical protein [Mesorhizobium amorphae]|uniref:hypothetical protein n=1 Tax=Mesorhizobium amorphae TaxID=71433 RepID=UPI00177C0339|nr:hypothetical protein [Mesorhizobium amorphae]